MNKIMLRKILKRVEKNGYKKKQTFINIDCDKYDISCLALNLYKEDFLSPEFAKAFWGECKNPDGGPLCVVHNCDIRDCETWEDHLQQMVILSDKEKFKYLEKFL